MKKITKILATLSVAGMLTACASTYPINGSGQPPVLVTTPIDMEMEIEMTGDPEAEDFIFIDNIPNMPSFMSIGGTITEIRPFYDSLGEDSTPVEGKYFVYVETAEGSQTVFFVDDLTAQIIDGEIAVGSAITGFFDANLPVPMIYPPQYHARVLVSDSLIDENDGVYVDTFGENLTAFSNPWQLAMHELVEIVLQDGTPFEGDIDQLENRTLVVLYSGTMSGTPTPVAGEEPAETGLEKLLVPTKIVVLFERAVHPIHYFTEEELAELGQDVFAPPISPDFGGALLLTPEDLNILWDNMFDPETVEIIVDGEAIEAPTPFVNREAGQIMLPVAAVAEAMGYNIYGEGADVVVGRGITFTVGVDSYFMGRMAPMELGAAPELVDDVLFVPMSFFIMVLSGDAFVEEGNIIVFSEGSWETGENGLSIVYFNDYE